MEEEKVVVGEGAESSESDSSIIGRGCCNRVMWRRARGDEVELEATSSCDGEGAYIQITLVVETPAGLCEKGSASSRCLSFPVPAPTSFRTFAAAAKDFQRFCSSL